MISAGVDNLPAIDHPDLVAELLLDVPYRSARGAVWKESGDLRAYAASTAASFQIIPPGYDGGFLRVEDATCNRCHENAGRPFRDYYDNILAYGELWGEDGIFSWHPFDAAFFVNENGDVKNFNYDNRRMRPDMVAAGVLEPYDPSQHPATHYNLIPGEWKELQLLARLARDRRKETPQRKPRRFRSESRTRS